MWNQHGGDMEKAINSIPKDTDKDDSYSTPDIYGRAVQFYLSLHSAAEQSRFTSEEVRVWRGLITMLALRNVLNIPLQWEAVNFPANDLFSDALSRLPQKKHLLYPDERAYQWDGKTFYVLTWTPDGVHQYDLAIYSPMTLIYPVVEWRRIFFDASENVHILHKFFYRAQDFSAGSKDEDELARARNIATSTFRNCVHSLQEGECKLVYFWLKTMRNHLCSNQINDVRDMGRHAGANSEAKDFIREHLEHYMNDLLKRNRSLRGASADNLEWQTFPRCDITKYVGLPYPLISAYNIPGGPVFAEQICYFQVEHGSDNPFEPCNYSWNYKIEGRLQPVPFRRRYRRRRSPPE